MDAVAGVGVLRAGWSVAGSAGGHRERAYLQLELVLQAAGQSVWVVRLTPWHQAFNFLILKTMDIQLTQHLHFNNVTRVQ